MGKEQRDFEGGRPAVWGMITRSHTKHVSGNDDPGGGNG